MVLEELHGRHIPNEAVRPLLIIFSAPGFNHDQGFLQGQKPVISQALPRKLPLKLSINAFGTGFPSWIKYSGVTPR
jgi:hypothetical protein